MLKPRNLADALTLSRLYAILPISALAIIGWAHAATYVYLAAIATDAVDGAVARWQETASAAGADLDGRVDFWFSVATLFWLVLLVPDIYEEHLLVVSLGLAAFALFILISFYTRGRVITPHLYSAKITTFLFMLWLPLGVLLVLPAWLVWLTVTVAIYSRFENVVHVLRKK